MRTRQRAVSLRGRGLVATGILAAAALAGCSAGGSAADRVSAHPSWWASAGATARSGSAPPRSRPSRGTPSGSSSRATRTARPTPTSGGSASTGRAKPPTAPTSTSATPTSAPTSPTATSSAPTSTAPAPPQSSAHPRALSAGRLHLVAAYIPFGDRRKAETAAYAKRHYGVSTWQLNPLLIVLHVTGSSSLSGARETFASDAPNRGELPGTCAHYIVGQDGTVDEIVPTTIVCRHAIGVNDKAIGIEMVQSTGSGGHWADQQILHRPAQIGAVLALVRALQRQYGIATSNVIGHAMVNASPQFHDLEGWRNDHVDWQPEDVAVVRARLAALH